MDLPDFDDVLAARERIAAHTHITPVLTSSFFDAETGASLFFKCENFQKVGAFKARGACNAVFALADELCERGVVTHSSGNHGQAISYASVRRGVASTVVMPWNAPQAKKDAVAGYGGTVVECEANDAAREAAVADIVRRGGARFIHPFNDPFVIAGQGTCALELLEQAGPLDTIVAPVGGGGLISGTCISAGANDQAIQIVGAEPKAVDDAARSKATGEMVQNQSTDTIADGLKTNLQPMTWAFVRDQVTDIITVEEAEIIETMRLVYERMKIIIEPSCAVPLAAIRGESERFEGQRVGVILTGGNVALGRLPWAGGD